MFFTSHRSLTGLCRARSYAASLAALTAFMTTSLSIHAVVVRGNIRDPLNRAVVAAPVQLMQNGQVVASTLSLPDGTFEIRSASAGRFNLMASGRGFGIYLSESFYGGDLDLLSRNITLTIAARKEEVSVTATGLPTPVEQISAAVSLISADDLKTREFAAPELRLQPGVTVMQTGQNGGQTSIFVRGANSDANKVLIDGVPANDVGGSFDFGLLSPTAMSGLEVHRGPDSVLYGSNALGSVVRFDTPRGSTARPVLNYSGNAGNFHTWQNEVTGSGAYRKFDYLAAFSRFESSNALPNDRFHLVTEAANIGYNWSGSTLLRGTVRNVVSATGLPGTFDFAGVTQLGKESDQDTYISGVIDTTYHANWHNMVRYIGARKRDQSQAFAPVGTSDGFGDYYGRTVTIRGANGTSGTGQAIIEYDPFPTRSDLVSNLDGVNYQTDYRFSQHFTALGEFQYVDERGSDRSAAFGTDTSAERRNYDYNLQFQGDVKGRLFYTFGGAVQKNYLFGTEGTPRIGLAYFPVRPGTGWFHGTKLRFNFSKGVQEPSLGAQVSSLYNLLLKAGDTADIAAYHVAPIGAERLRTYEGGVEQNIYRDKLKLSFAYFHNEFGRQTEYVPPSGIQLYFGIPASKVMYAYLNSLDFKAQGIETEIEYRATRHIFLRGGYTYLDAIVQHSFSSDAVDTAGGSPTVNPNYPDVAIGAYTPLVGQRPFRRPPQTGYLVASYVQGKWSAGVKAAFVSRSDDTTFLAYSDQNYDNTLLLPNRNLAFGYQRIDANVTWQLKRYVALFTQLNNLLGEQHMGPIGYPGLPFNFRAGVKMRLGGGGF